MINMCRKKCMILWVCLLIALNVSCADQEEKSLPKSYDHITSQSLYMDAYKVHRTLEVLLYKSQNDRIDADGLKPALIRLLRDMKRGGPYFEYADRIHIDKNGELFGAVSDDNPIGGGPGYQEVLTEGTYLVHCADELVDALKKAEEGEVIFIPGDVKIDVTSLMFSEDFSIVLKNGVTLASDRGHEGSLGAKIYTSALRSKPLIKAKDHSRITGLTLQGPDHHIRRYRIPTHSVGIALLGEQSIVDNCEISGFPHAGICVWNGHDHKIHHNYIHHNRTERSGYGIFIDDAKVSIYGNLLNENTVSVYGTGLGRCSIEMAHNVVMGDTHTAAVKMDVTRHGRTVYTGDQLNVEHNTFFTKAPPVVTVEIPRHGIQITNNYFAEQKEESFTNIDVEHDQNAYGLLDAIAHQKDDEPDYFSLHTVSMNTTRITSRIYHTDLEDVYQMLHTLFLTLDASERQTIEQKLTNAIRMIEKYGRAYDYLEQPYIEVDNEIYGVNVEKNPFGSTVGGGYGYEDILLDGDYIVHTKEDLIQALAQARSGDVVFVDGTAVIDLSDSPTLIIYKGVTLASDRGHNHSPGALIFSNTFLTPMFSVRENVRITGICIRGADLKKRMDHHARSFSGEDPPGHDYYYLLPLVSGIRTNDSSLTVDNCEIAGFANAAIVLGGGENHHIHNNYIHHNQRHGLGYGVTHASAYSIIEYNLFNYNRHDLAASGVPESGYTARHNIQMGESLSHCFDVHGGRDRGDGTNIAGELFYIYNNLFLSDRYPYSIRGVPLQAQHFYKNVLYQPLSFYARARLFGTTDEEKEKFIVRDNVFNLKDEPVVVP